MRSETKDGAILLFDEITISEDAVIDLAAAITKKVQLDNEDNDTRLHIEVLMVYMTPAGDGMQVIGWCESVASGPKRIEAIVPLDAFGGKGE